MGSVGIVLVAARYTGRLPTETLRRNAEALVAATPALRMRAFGATLGVARADADPVAVHVRSPVRRDSRAPWAQVVEDELRWPIDPRTGPTFRVVHVPEVGGGTVILAAHPAAVDATSLEVLVDGLLAGEPPAHAEVLGPPALDAVGVPPALGWAAPLLGRVWAREVVAHQRDPVLVPDGVGPVRSLCAFRRGTAHGLRRLRVALDRHEVELRAFVTAALALAVAATREDPDLPLEVPVDLEVDLRPHAAFAGDAIGMYRSTVRVGAKVHGDAAFWDTARRIGRRARATAGWRVHLVPHVIADRVDAEALLDEVGADPVRPGAPPAVADPGPWNRRIDHGSFVLRDVFGAEALARRGAPLTVSVRAMPDGVCLSAVGAAPHVGRATLESLIDAIAALCESPPADHATIALLGTPAPSAASAR